MRNAFADELTRLGDQDPRLATLWLWHSSEESEHKTVAFDLYQALDGAETWRRKWMRRTTFFFLMDALRQTLSSSPSLATGSSGW